MCVVCGYRAATRLLPLLLVRGLVPSIQVFEPFGPRDAGAAMESAARASFRASLVNSLGLIEG